MIVSMPRRLALAWMLGVAAASAQTPTLQDLQNKLLQFEESSQKTIAELKVQIAALQQGQKPPVAVPPAPVAPQTQSALAVLSGADKNIASPPHTKLAAIQPGHFD
jgi:hypothetical protein